MGQSLLQNGLFQRGKVTACEGFFGRLKTELFDLPLKFHPAAIRASAFLNRPRFLDQLRLEFSGFIQGGGLVEPPDFISEIGTLLPIAPCGRNSL